MIEAVVVYWPLELIVRQYLLSRTLDSSISLIYNQRSYPEVVHRKLDPGETGFFAEL